MSQLTPQENFRLGFLLRCAEEGCSADEIRARVKTAYALSAMEKQAKGGAGGAANAFTNLAGTYFGLPINLALLNLGIAGVGGAGLGYGAAKMQDESIDTDEVKRQELLAAYKSQAERARQRAAQRQYQKAAPKAPRLLD